MAYTKSLILDFIKNLKISPLIINILINIYASILRTASCSKSVHLKDKEGNLPGLPYLRTELRADGKADRCYQQKVKPSFSCENKLTFLESSQGGVGKWVLTHSCKSSFKIGRRNPWETQQRED